MGTTALDKEVGRIAKKLEERIRQSSGNGGLLLTWRNRKVISGSEWQEQYLYPNQEALGYLPDDYFYYPFLAGAQPPDNLKEQYRQWLSDYVSLIEHTKNANYGKEVLCKNCILNPGQLKEAGQVSYFESVLIKELNLEVASQSIVSNGDSSGSQKTEVKYPCPVLNRFECPYRDSRHANDEILNLFGYVSKTISAAIDYAKHLTYYNDTTYYANFKNGAITSVNALGGKAYSPPGSLELEFGNLKLSKVPVRRVIDVYNIMTDPSALATALEQYSSWKEGVKNDINKETISMMVNFVMQFKDRMRLDDFVDYHSDAIQVENKWLAYAAKECPPPTPHGKCQSCNVEANIHCTGCNYWVCVEHWRLHKENRHMK